MSNSPMISLTPAQRHEGGVANIQVKAWQLLTDDQQIGFTRLRLSGGQSLEVKESTDEIDHPVRLAASRNLVGFTETAELAPRN